MNGRASHDQSLSWRDQLRVPDTLLELLHAAHPGTIRSAVAAAGAGWLPAVVLSVLYGPASLKSFLSDVVAQSRLLVVIPLLILTERPLVARMAAIARHFVVADLVEKEDLPRFEKVAAAFER